MQFDADTVGSASMAADAEICMMAADTMEALGIPRGSYVVKVNNRKVLDGVMEAIGIGDESHAATRLTAWRAIDKLDRLGEDNVRRLLGAGRRDESGDFTKGAGLDEEQINVIMSFVLPETPSADRQQESPAYSLYTYNTSSHGRYTESVKNNPLIVQGVLELGAIAALVKASGYASDQIRIDQSVVRGLEYYTGPVYEVELTFPSIDDDGRPVRFGSVGGGGRYDGLVSRFRGESVPATGFSIGVSRLLAALTHLGKINAQPEPGPVIVTTFDRSPERIADYQNFVARLRRAGIRTELYLGAGKFGPQMKYADRRGSPCVIIQGTDEKQKGEVQIKDLILGAELAGLSKERADYLKTQADAQFAVTEDRLVEAVRQVLSRHDVKQAGAPHSSMACLSDQATQTLKQAGKEDISKILEETHAGLVDHEVDYIEYGDPDKLTAKQRAKLNCQLLKQVLVHRAERLMIAAGEMFDSKNLYGLALVVRGHIEAVAVLGYFARRLDSLHKKNIEFERFEEDIANGLLGAKDAIFDKAKAPVNILTCLEDTDRHLDAELFGKRTGMFQEIYTWLSDFAHPNFCSNKTAFTLDKETGRMLLRKDEETRDDHCQMLNCLCISANMFSWLLTDFSARLERAFPVETQVGA
jgi:histidyl-tRNA synthetase